MRGNRVREVFWIDVMGCFADHIFLAEAMHFLELAVDQYIASLFVLEIDLER